MKQIKLARDGAVYTRCQEGHSVVCWLMIVLFTGGLGLIPALYYAASPRHYYHL